MTKAAVILAVVSALCMGAALGFMVGVLTSRHFLAGGPPLPHSFMRHLPRMFHDGLHGPAGMPSARAATEHLQRLLDLTPAQADAVRAEIERTRDDFAQVRDSLHARIERHLTAQQRERWLRVVRERRPDDFDEHRHARFPEPEGEHRR